MEGNNVRVARGVWTTATNLLREWRIVNSAIPPFTREAARGVVEDRRYSEAARGMMKNLGWTPGTGLGPNAQGISTPVEPGVPRKGKQGLGLGPRRRKACKKRTPQLKAAVIGDVPVYGMLHASDSTFEVVELTTRGLPKPMGKLIAIHLQELREPLRWGGGVVGIGERVFPHPNDWRLGDICKPLHKIEVKDLTRCFTEGISKRPNFMKAWDSRVPGLDYRTLLTRYKPGLATPKDFGSHFKLILHRAFFTNPHNPSATSENCRACRGDRESIAHFGECVTLKPMFKLMRVFDGGTAWDDVRLNLFGVNDMKGVLPEGTSTLHFMLWKHTLIQLTMNSLNGTPVNASEIIDKAVLRLHKRVKALEYNITCEYCRSDARKSEVDLGKYRKRLEGIGSIDDGGRVTLHPDLQTVIDLARL